MLEGGQLSRRQSAFSGDGKLVLTPTGRNLNIYATATGEQVGQLEGHTGDVTCVVLDPRDSDQAYSAGRDGTLRLWRYHTEECVRVLHVRETVRSMVIHATLGVAYLSIEWRDADSGRVICFNLDKGQAGATAMKTRAAGPLAMNPQGSLVATIDRHSLFVWRVGLEITQPLNLHHTKPYTCVALSANDSVLAAGDVTGRVLIWRDFAAAVPADLREGVSTGKKRAEVPPPLTTLHWHPAPVGCLAFSPDTTYLLSGGREGVLVMWQLETNRPNFLPRLGGPLVGLLHNPADAALLLIRQADNTIRVVNTATMKVECSILGVRPRPPSLSAPAAAAATCLQPHTGLLVLPTSNATLQLFDVHRHRHVALLQMAPRNMVAPTASNTSGTAQPLGSDTDMTDAQCLAEAGTPHGLDGGVLEPCVVHTAFSGDGKTLATVEIRPDAGPYGSSEAALRFWDSNSAAPRSGAPVPFVLNTRVNEPHRGGVTSIAYHPSREMVATTGGCHDAVSAGASAALEGHQGPCELKIWERIAAPKRPGSKVESPTCWRCRSVASHKGQPLSAAAFSPDGSLLVVAAGPKATLWEPAHSTCVCTLPSPPELLGPYAPHLQRLVFVPGTPFLVGSTGSSLTVWNMLTCSVHWSSPLRTCSLAADPHHPFFAVSVPLGGKRLHQHGMAPTQSAAEATFEGIGVSKEQQQPQQQQQQQQQQKEGGEGAGARGADGVRSPERKRRGSGRASTGDPPPSSQQQQQQQQEGARATADADGGTDLVGHRSMPGTPHHQQQQQQQQQQRARPSPPSCFVVVFNPASPMPLMVAHVPSASHTALLFVQSDMPQHMEHTAAPRDGCEDQQQQHGHTPLTSPLLVVTEDRGYAYIGHEGSLAAGSLSQQHKRQQQQHKRLQAAGGEGVSAFEAAFGAAAVARKQQHVNEDGSMEVEEDSSQPRWRQLFDAPSHALPAPMDLAASFLQLITSDLGKEE